VSAVTRERSARTELSAVADAELALRARAEPTGPEFEALYARHAGAVRRFLAALLGDAALAEDVTQEAFFRAYRHLERYEPRRAFRPWLLAIARNAGLNALRSRKKAVAADVDGEASRATSDRVPRAAAAREASALARAALADLEPEVRALLAQRHGLGLTQAELAQSWGVTERTIRNRLDAATRELTAAIVRRRGGAE